ncbi:hypothetical protein M011DRAFT_470144 [Sporormia fimetaria CBS 119925]|uniref:Uncharacterized protein n=1 Tax=Sporormia fimetaria CBS 119925 TaxID=1340428 RepID=A0A6A6V5Q5_9PLEO|nr:hypothetical protein M011DRAFT_470144 [Sporormia fimetaria CBS 119925]
MVSSTVEYPAVPTQPSSWRGAEAERLKLGKLSGEWDTELDRGRPWPSLSPTASYIGPPQREQPTRSAAELERIATFPIQTEVARQKQHFRVGAARTENPKLSQLLPVQTNSHHITWPHISKKFIRLPVGEYQRYLADLEQVPLNARAPDVLFLPGHLFEPSKI